MVAFEVRVAEKSRANTFDGGSTRRIKYLTAFYTERTRWLNYFCFLSWSALLRLLPVLLLDGLLKLLSGTNQRAKFSAWVWIWSHPWTVLKKRNLIQAQRKRPDAEILPLISAKYWDGSELLSMVFRAYLRLAGIRLGF